MTIGFRSSAVADGPSVNAATVALTIPAAQAGDWLIAWACEQASPTWTADQVLAAAPDIVSTRTGGSLAVWVHQLVTADLGKTVTFTSTLPAHRPAAGMLVLSSASGLGVSAISNGSSASVDCPSITTVRDHDAIVTIGFIQANTARTWTGWTGSTPGPAGGNGAAGAGGAEFACFYDLDQGTQGATGTLSEVTTPLSGWCAVTLGIVAAAAPRSVPLGTGQDLATQAHMAAKLGISRAAVTNNLWYAKSDATWGALVPLNGNPDGSWS